MTLPFFRLGAGACAQPGDRFGRWSKVSRPATIDSAPDVSYARRKLQTLNFPLPLPARVAVLDDGFESGRGLRSFSGDPLGWMAWAPDALVLPLTLAISLADQQRQGWELPVLSVAIVVLSSVTEGPLEQARRDDIWRAFRVPVFEQLRASNGIVIARECEVHHGLHMDEAAAEVETRESELLVRRARTGLAADILHGCCECGAETPRLLNLSRLQMAAAAGR